MKRFHWRPSHGLALATFVAGLLAAVVVIEPLPPEWRLVNEPLHSTIEGIGSLIAVALATFLLQRKREKRAGTLFPPALGFMAMGLLDMFHATTTPGKGFVLLHSVASLAGGLWFALVWFPALTADGERRWKRWAPWVVGAGAVGFGVWTLVARETLPAMTAGATFTTTAVVINVLAGTLFMLGAVRLLLDFYRGTEFEICLLACMAGLFGMASLVFPFSTLWDDSWWVWHLLRLTAYVLGLGFIVRQYQLTLAAHERADEEYRTIIRTTLDGFLRVGDRGRILEVNDAYCRLTGYSRDELVALTVADVEAVEGPEEVARRLKRLQVSVSGSEHFETRHRRKDGSLIDFEVSVTLVPAADTRVVSFLRDITERGHREADLRASDDRYRLLFASNPQPMWVYDLDTLAFVEVNDAAVQHYGYSREEFLAKTLHDIRPHEDVPVLLEQLSCSPGLHEGGIVRHAKKDGTAIEVEVASHPIAWMGRCARLALLRDVTSERRVQRLVAEHEERFELTARASHDSLWELDPRTGRVWWSEGFASEFGHDPGSLGDTVESWSDKLHPNDHDRVVSGFNAALAGGNEAWTDEYRFRRGDGSYADVLDRAYIMRDTHGRPVRVVGAVMDIADLRRVERERAEVESKYQTVVRNIDEIAYVVEMTGDPMEGRVVFVNAQVERTTGHAPQEFVENPELWNSLIHPDDLSAVMSLTQRMFRERTPIARRYRVHHRQMNQYRWVDDRVAPQFDPDGVHVTLFGIARDITDAVLAEETLKQSEVRLILALKKAQHVADELARREASQKNLNVLLLLALEDLELDELLQRALVLVLNSPWPATLGVGAVFLVDGDSHELVLRAHNGIDAPILERCARVPFGVCLCGRVAATGLPLHSPCVDAAHEIVYPHMPEHGHYCIPIAAGGSVLGVLTIYTKVGHSYDAREVEFLGTFASTLAGMIVRERAEERLRQTQKVLLHSQKMDVVGRLTGGVAHDFNNLLTAILGYSNFVLDALEPDNDLRADVAEIKNAGERAAALTQQLLAFSRRQVMQPQIVDLGETVSGIERMLRRIIGEDIRLTTTCATGVGSVKADPHQLGQVLMNLAVNARDAMPGGGILTIEITTVDLDDDWAGLHPGSHAGSYVRLLVRDTGCGMPPDVLAHVFEPFFTTKGNKGTGLGLATVYGIVAQSGGCIDIVSTPGHGTSVNIYLPQVEDESPGKATVAANARGGSETILLVDDEEAVRNMARRMLERLGYTVLQARDGLDALAVSERSERIDVVVTDVVMPGMSGPELVDRLAALRPGIRVMYISGYSGDFAEALAALGDRAFVQKPFDLNAMALKIREVLDGPAMAP